MARIFIKADGSVESLSARARNRQDATPVTKGKVKVLTTISPKEKPAKSIPRHVVGKKTISGPRKIDTALLKHPFYEEAVTELRERGIDIFSQKGQDALREALKKHDQVHHKDAIERSSPLGVTELDQLKDSIASKVKERADHMLEIGRLERLEVITAEQESRLNNLKERLISINSYLDGARKRIAAIRRKTKA